MFLAYVLCGIVVAGLFFLAWVYYILFYKEKTRDEKPLPESFYTLNEELAFSSPSGPGSALPSAGKMAAAAGLLAASRRNNVDRHGITEEHQDRAFTDPNDEVFIPDAVDALESISGENKTDVNVRIEKDNIGAMDTNNGIKLADGGKTVRFDSSAGAEDVSFGGGTKSTDGSRNDVGSAYVVGGDSLSSPSVHFGTTSSDNGGAFSQHYGGSSGDHGYGSGNSANDQSQGAYDGSTGYSGDGY